MATDVDTRNEQIKILSKNKHWYTAKTVFGGLLAGGLLAGFIATKATANVVNPSALGVQGYLDFTKDYLARTFQSLRGISNESPLKFIKPDNALETGLLGLLAGAKVWQYTQWHKKNQVNKEIDDIKMGRGR